MIISNNAAKPFERLAYSIDEARALLSIGRTTLYEMKKRGEIHFIKIAGRTLVPRSEIERLCSMGLTDRKP